MAKEIIEFVQELRYVVKERPKQVVQDLHEIKIIDSQYSQLREKYLKLLLLSILPIIISFLLISISSFSLSFLVISIAAFCISIAFTCYFYQQLHKYARLKIDAYRYQIVGKLADLLQRDMSGTSILNVNLDFTQSLIHSKLISEGKHPLRLGWKFKVYQDNWLSLQGKFCDRTTFDLNITEHYRNSSGWKQSRSGKRKYKSKNKFKGSEICLQLCYSAKKYGAIQVFQQDAMDAIKLPNYAEIKNFKLNSKFICLKVNLPPKFDHQHNYHRAISDQHKIDTNYATITAMFLSLYQILNLARTLSK